LKEEEERYK